MRKPNELWISALLLEQMMRVGYKSPAYRVKEGPEEAARIIGVHWEHYCVVLEYDRPIDEAVFLAETPPFFQPISRHPDLANTR